MLLKTLASVTAFAALASAKFFYVGVAQSSGEFGVYSQTKQKGFGLPGRFGVDYSFIDKKGVDVYVDQNRVRLTTRRIWCRADKGSGQPFPNCVSLRAHVSSRWRSWCEIQ